MKYCCVCGKGKDTSHTYEVFTGRVLGRNSVTLYKQTTTTTTYGEFEEHKYDVCQSCAVKWNIIFPIAVFVLSTLLLKLLLRYEGWDAALFLALFPAAIVIYKYVNVWRRLMKDAIAQREMQLSGEYKAYLIKPAGTNK